MPSSASANGSKVLRFSMDIQTTVACALWVGLLLRSRGYDIPVQLRADVRKSGGWVVV